MTTTTDIAAAVNAAQEARDAIHKLSGALVRVRNLSTTERESLSLRPIYVSLAAIDNTLALAYGREALR